MAAERLTVRAADGREIKVLRDGPRDAQSLVFHCGTPIAPAEFPTLADPARERGWQLFTYARPGYAGSSRHDGRAVTDAAGDVAAILDALGRDRFLTLGWSGGGPHALACAALLSDRCDGAASLAGVAPFDAEASTSWRAWRPATSRSSAPRPSPGPHSRPSSSRSSPSAPP